MKRSVATAAMLGSYSTERTVTADVDGCAQVVRAKRGLRGAVRRLIWTGFRDAAKFHPF